MTGFFSFMCAPVPYDWAALLVRLAVGFSLLTYGLKKFFHQEDAANFPGVLFFPGRVAFYLAMSIEIIVPCCLIAGFCTRLAALPAVVSMSIATRVSRGPCFTSPALLYALMMVVVAIMGAGRFSLDFLLA